MGKTERTLNARAQLYERGQIIARDFPSFGRRVFTDSLPPLTDATSRSQPETDAPCTDR
jgi:hypothetical protein